MSEEKNEINENEQAQDGEASGETQAVAEPKEESCEDKLKAMEDKYLRTHAEFENIKKRLEKEKHIAIDYASEKFAKDLLPVLDALEMASLIDDKEQFDKLKEGLKLTLDKLIDVFGRHHIEPVSHKDGFDPNFHEAVMQTSIQEHENDAIVQVMQKGYKYKQRVLRPSLVSINKR